MYEILLERQAEKDLKRLPPVIFARIISHLKGLAENPKPVGCRKIVGAEYDWRIRVGDYRIIYELDDKLHTVKVWRIKHRREAYR
ncbi:plasmid stabilization protein [Thioploca ingrica]|uniref:Plasmid stabilization protein n=1 Tax=Thioploca ingrica TaxID=40754 RepID=A0A090BU91_9GAMM|nr:plasmid stabilization protein [Thioploca ingrica]